MDLTTYLAKGYDLSDGATTFTSADLSAFSTYFLEFIWSNVTVTLDGILLIRQTDDSKLYDSIETFTLYSAVEKRSKNILDVLKNIRNIFLPKNKILTSEGIIHVYYWLEKNIEAKNYPQIRKFLMQFEKQRRKNRELIRKKPDSKNINMLFVEYDNFNRSTNNQQSHKERYRILKNNFDNWLGSGKFIKQNTT